jgi:hypothetical protein
MALCCEDWNAGGSIENAADSTLEKLWSGRERRRLRQIHTERRGEELPACKACQRPHAGPQWFQDLHPVR